MGKLKLRWQKLFIITLILALGALPLIGCSDDLSNDLNGTEGIRPHSFYLESSSPREGSFFVSAELDRVELLFNEMVDRAEVAIKEKGGISERVPSIRDGKKVTVFISELSFELEENREYIVLYDVFNQKGRRIGGRFRFNTYNVGDLDIYDPADRVNLSRIKSMSSEELGNADGGINETILQAFYWEMYENVEVDGVMEYNKDKYPEEGNLWNLLAKRAQDFADAGFTALWFPPAHKSFTGAEDVGYGVYDKWDLGEFEQQGSTRTKYGTREELERAVEALSGVGVRSYYDAVFNQRFGGDLEELLLPPNSPDRANQVIETYSYFGVQAGRAANYTRNRWGNLWHDFNWDYRAFTAGDVAIVGGNRYLGLYMFPAHRDFHGTDQRTWGQTFGNDFLMGMNVDYYNEDHPNRKVIDEMKAWGEWIINDIGFDGFRMDATLHIDNRFVRDWVHHVKANTDKDLFFVAEAWRNDVGGLVNYLDAVDAGQDFKVFDFPLRDNFRNLFLEELNENESQLNMSHLSNFGINK